MMIHIHHRPRRIPLETLRDRSLSLSDMVIPMTPADRVWYVHWREGPKTNKRAAHRSNVFCPEFLIERGDGG